MGTEKEREALLKQLTLLGNIRRLHEWTFVGQKDAEEVDKEEEELESEESK